MTDLNPPNNSGSRRHIRRRLLLIAAAILLTGGLALLFVIYINWSMIRDARPNTFSRVDDVPDAPVALVLGARVYSDGTLSPMLDDRVLSAVELYKAGKVRKLLMSGDNSSTSYDEVTAMRKRAISLGVKSDDVVRDFAGFRTFDSIIRAHELWDIQSMTIVTQAFHLSRAIYTAREHGIEANGLIADRRPYGSKSMAHSLIREIASRTVAWLDTKLLHPTPHFLGRKETLSGDKQDAEERAKKPQEKDSTRR